MRYLTTIRHFFREILSAALCATLLATTAPAVAEGLETDTTINIKFVQGILALVGSDTPTEADTSFDTDDFDSEDDDDVFDFLNNPEFQAALLARPDVNTEDLQLLIDFLEVTGSDEKTQAFNAAVGVGTPFGAFFETTNLDGVNAAVQAFANSDPFIGFEGRFTNTGDAPLNIDVGFDLAILPIDVLTFSTFDTALTAVLESDGPANGTPTDVRVFHTISGSPTPEAPLINNAVNFEVATDFAIDLVPGIATSAETELVDFLPQNLLGLPNNQGGLFGMFSFLAIDELQPGDSVLVRFAFSVGTKDGSIPLLPAEAIVLALEQGVVGDAEPEPEPEPEPQPLPTLLSYKTKLTRGSVCTNDAPINVGEQCKIEADCGGIKDDTAFCVRNKFPKDLQVSLLDQFEFGLFDVKKPKNLLNPADSTEEGILDPEAHLRSYPIKPTRTKPPQPRHVRQRAIVDDRFGTLIVDTIKPDRLLVPSAIDLENPVEPPDPQSQNLDHYKCYRIKIKKNACEADPAVRCRIDADCQAAGLAGVCNLGFPRGVQASVLDRFEPLKLYDVKKPLRLCNPVDKNDEGINNPENHLTCYQVKPARGEPKHDRLSGIFVNNQFGSEKVDTIKEEQLCVPSSKNDLGPVR